MTDALELGADRIVCKLSTAGAGRRLAFDALARELGNGWVDLTARIMQADDDRWMPYEQGAELLSARWVGVARSLGTGDIMRRLQATTGYAYELLVDDEWHRTVRLSPHAPQSLDLLGVVPFAVSYADRSPAPE